MEEEDIERQMNELDMLLEGSAIQAFEPVIRRIDPLPLGRVGTIVDIDQSGLPGQILTSNGTASGWVTINNDTAFRWSDSSQITTSTWITPGQINPVTEEPYNDFSLKSSWLYEPTKKDLPYNFFTSLTLIKNTKDDQVALLKRLRKKHPREKPGNNNNRNSEASN